MAWNHLQEAQRDRREGHKTPSPAAAPPPGHPCFLRPPHTARDLVMSVWDSTVGMSHCLFPIHVPSPLLLLQTAAQPGVVLGHCPG